jgi:ribonuclease VapC
MVLDTSAIIATIANEPDSSHFRAAMLGAESLLISSVAVLETKIALFARLGLDAVGLFDELLEKAGIVVVPFDDEMVGVAFDAFRLFGEGTRASGSVEHRRLCCLCAGAGPFPVPAFQG